MGTGVKKDIFIKKYKLVWKLKKSFPIFLWLKKSFDLEKAWIRIRIQQMVFRIARKIQLTWYNGARRRFAHIDFLHVEFLRVRMLANLHNSPHPVQNIRRIDTGICSFAILHE